VTRRDVLENPIGPADVSVARVLVVLSPA
jgi:hypothetical protein